MDYPSTPSLTTAHDGTISKLLRIDMRDNWDWKTNITIQALQKAENEETGSYPPSLVRGALFEGPRNQSKIYTYGGTTFFGNASFGEQDSPASNTYSLWSYDTSAHVWDQYDVTKGSPLRPNRGSSAEAPTHGLSFYLNGQIDAGSSAVSEASLGNNTEFLDGMIVLNTVDTSSRNLSTATLGDARVAGGLQFIDAIGSNGALIAIGGLRRNENQTEVITLDHVHLCDDFTANSTWYRQSATGDIPPPRSDFCIVAASAPDNSSHNMYIYRPPLSQPRSTRADAPANSYLYGGIDPTNTTTTTAPILYDDIHILSLPSFTWTRVFGGESPRWGHTCHLVGARQMLTVGGTMDAFVYDVETRGAQAAAINASALTCDWETKGVAVLDMSTLKWGSVFDAYAAAYRVPDDVVRAIGGGADGGGATATAPAGGFEETAVAAMFSRRVVAATPPPSPSGDSGAADDRDIAPGTVAGAVVGGVAAVGLLLGVCLCILRRKRRAREKAREEEEEEDRNRDTEGHQGVGYPEFPDASRYELNGQGRVPEMTGGALAHELHATEEPRELASSHRPFELSTDLGR
ncbi:hypothetical protein SLS58_002735 [Diplodia intermedia]|uniref:Kelch repeat protein n=1 Tax=Diplodia intermedia TaxID=856260 RepID=A0ABR3TYA3_9PEZI